MTTGQAAQEGTCMYSERCEDGDRYARVSSKEMNPLALFGMTFLSFSLGMVCTGTVKPGAGMTAIFLVGAICLLADGLLAMRTGKRVTSTAFIINGLFWCCFSLIVAFGAESMAGMQSSSYCMFLVIWAMFSLIIFITTMKASLFLGMYHVTMTFCFVMMAAAYCVPQIFNNLLLSAGTFAIIAGMTALFMTTRIMFDSVQD